MNPVQPNVVRVVIDLNVQTGQLYIAGPDNEAMVLTILGEAVKVVAQTKMRKPLVQPTGHPEAANGQSGAN